MTGALQEGCQPGGVEIAALPNQPRQGFDIGQLGAMALAPILHRAAAAPLVKGIADLILHHLNRFAPFPGANAIDCLG